LQSTVINCASGFGQVMAVSRLISSSPTPSMAATDRTLHPIPSHPMSCQAVPWFESNVVFLASREAGSERRFTSREIPVLVCFTSSQTKSKAKTHCICSALFPSRQASLLCSTVECRTHTPLDRRPRKGIRAGCGRR
jgi:hypothetical protein